MSKNKKDNETTSKLRGFFQDLEGKAYDKAHDLEDKVDDRLNAHISKLMKTNPEAAAAATLAKSGGKKMVRKIAKSAKENPFITAATVLSVTSGAGLIRSAIYVGAGAAGEKYKVKLKDSLSGKFSDSHNNDEPTYENNKPSNDDDIIEAEFEEIKNDEPKRNSNDFKP